MSRQTRFSSFWESLIFIDSQIISYLIWLSNNNDDMHLISSVFFSAAFSVKFISVRNTMDDRNYLTVAISDNEALTFLTSYLEHNNNNKSIYFILRYSILFSKTRIYKLF